MEIIAVYDNENYLNPKIILFLEVIRPGITIKNKFRRVSKWTLSLFVERAIYVHGYKYNYSLVKESDIISSKSPFALTSQCKGPVYCNILY